MAFHDWKSGFLVFGVFHVFMISVLWLVRKDERLDLSVNDRDGWNCWPASDVFQDMHCREVLTLSFFLHFSLLVFLDPRFFPFSAN